MLLGEYLSEEEYARAYERNLTSEEMRVLAEFELILVPGNLSIAIPNCLKYFSADRALLCMAFSARTDHNLFGIAI